MTLHPSRFKSVTMGQATDSEPFRCLQMKLAQHGTTRRGSTATGPAGFLIFLPSAANNAITGLAKTCRAFPQSSSGRFWRSSKPHLRIEVLRATGQMLKRSNVAVVGSHHNSDFWAPPATPGEQGPTAPLVVSRSKLLRSRPIPCKALACSDQSCKPHVHFKILGQHGLVFDME